MAGRWPGFVANGVVVHNSFNELSGRYTELPADFYVPSTERIGPRTDLAAMPRVTAQATEFSEDVVRTNHELVQGYKKLQNEF